MAKKSGVFYVAGLPGSRKVGDCAGDADAARGRGGVWGRRELETVNKGACIAGVLSRYKDN